MKIQLFGVLSDTMKKKEILIPDVKNTVSLKEKIRKEFPQLGNQSFVIAVNKKAAIGNINLASGDTIALIPPFAGG